VIAANVTIMVSDLERSLDFYTNVLGFLPGQRHRDHYAEVKAPGLTVGLHPGRKKAPRFEPDTISIGLEVADLEKATVALGKKGLSFEFLENQANKLALFSDPDGTAMYLLEVK
jgi:catechol 2,3-dioxygenase-like lactoylglutathione lyase family enzyme